MTAARPPLVLSAGGIAAGLVAARAAAQMLRHLVWGVSIADPLTFAGAAMFVAVIAVAATLIPALAIARLNPITALRQP